MITAKYGNAFFLKEMGLGRGHYIADLLRDPSLTKYDFLTSCKKKRRRRPDEKRSTIFKYAYARC